MTSVGKSDSVPFSSYAPTILTPFEVKVPVYLFIAELVALDKEGNIMVSQMGFYQGVGGG